jgi:hypothetical protein
VVTTVTQQQHHQYRAPPSQSSNTTSTEPRFVLTCPSWIGGASERTNQIATLSDIRQYFPGIADSAT